MSSDQWQRLEQLYHAARERPPADRSAFLAAACPDDSALRREIESLLRQEGDAFLETPALEAAAHVAAHALGSDEHGYAARVASANLIGRRFGVYEILSLLGA